MLPLKHKVSYGPDCEQGQLRIAPIRRLGNPKSQETRRPTMPATPDNLFAFLENLGITTTTVDHAPVFTVEEAQAVRGSMAGAHTKNLFLRDAKRRFFLVCLEEDRAVDLKALRPLIEARGGLSFASPEALMDHLGVRPGAVSPLALLNDTAGLVTAVLDGALLATAIVNVHPLDNTKTVSIRPDDLMAFLTATGHVPIVLDAL